MDNMAGNMISPRTYSAKAHAGTHDCLHPAFAVQYDSACTEVLWNRQNPIHAHQNQSSAHNVIEPMLLLQPEADQIGLLY
jgi:hypothetical protein